jgi:hypothetical protein
MALTLPTAAQAAAQTPVNTFSPTSSPLANTTNSLTYVYNSTLGVWTSSGASAGGVVTTVTGTAPIVSSGGSTPAISITAATTGAPGSAQLATAVESAGGTSTTRVSTPAYTVPKDTAGMGGAALLPSGGNYGGTTTGMFRFNTTSGHTEFYDGAAWQTSVNRSGDQMSGGIDFGPTSFPCIAGGTSYGSNWSGIVSGNVPGYAFGYGNGGVLTLSRNGDVPLGLNRVDGAGPFVNLYDANVLAGFIGKNSTGWFSYQVTATPLFLASTASIVYIQGNNAGGPVIFRDGGGNSIAFISNAGTFNTVSDESLKVDIEPLTYGLSEVEQLEPKSYKLKSQVNDEYGDAPTQLGLLAQEVAQVIPEVVDYREDEKGDTICSIAYTELVPVLINAIKELKQEFDDYKATHP